MNVWTRSVFDALQKREPDTVLFLSMLYLPLLAAGVSFGVVQVYARMSIQWRWRAWLNDELLDNWLKNGRYYQLDLVSGGHRNPECRLADDLRVATDAPIDFAMDCPIAWGTRALRIGRSVGSAAAAERRDELARFIQSLRPRQLEKTVPTGS